MWHPIPGFEGNYSVSPTGQVRRESTGKVLKPRIDRYGYVKYTLYRDGVPHYRTAHRLVALSILGPPPPGKGLVLHKDDNPENNEVSNLYWGDLSDNQRDIIKNGNNHGRNKSKCVNGHRYTEENTYRNPKTGHRACNTCRNKHTAQQNERRKKERNGYGSH